MTRETRIGLLVGLVFIFAFGIILGELTNDSEQPVTTGSLRDVDYLTHEADRGALVDPRYVRPRERRDRSDEPREAARRESPTEHRPVDPRKTTRRYRTRSGDTLTKIARLAYGEQNGHLYEVIYQANQRTLPSRNVVPVGVVLTIPPMP